MASLRSRIRAWFLVVALFIVMTGSLGYYLISQSNSAVDKLLQRDVGAGGFEQIKEDFTLQSETLDNYIEKGTEEALADYDSKKVLTEKGLARASDFAKKTGHTKNMKLLKEIKTRIDNIDKIGINIIQLKAKPQTEEDKEATEKAINKEKNELALERNEIKELLTKTVVELESGLVEKLKEAKEMTSRAITIMPISGIAAVLISIFISFIISRSISTPIAKLTKAANDISKGKLDVQIDPKLKESKDEISNLAESFERMLAAIKFLKAEKEQ